MCAHKRSLDSWCWWPPQAELKMDALSPAASPGSKTGRGVRSNSRLSASDSRLGGGVCAAASSPVDPNVVSAATSGNQIQQFRLCRSQQIDDQGEQILVLLLGGA